MFMSLNTKQDPTPNLNPHPDPDPDHNPDPNPNPNPNPNPSPRPSQKANPLRNDDILIVQRLRWQQGSSREMMLHR